MSTPHTASTSDARKRLAELNQTPAITTAGGIIAGPPVTIALDPRECVLNRDLHCQRPDHDHTPNHTPDHTGLPGYFIAPDAFDDLWVWRERGDYPVPVVAAHDMRDDPDLWAAIVRAVEGNQ